MGIGAAAGAIIGGTVAAGGAIAASSIASKSANKAADTAAQATTQAADEAARVQREQIALARDIYGENKSILAPYAALGNVDDSTLVNALGLNGEGGARDAYNAFRKNTGYDWQLSEGQRAINGNFAGAGTYQSGARDRALMEYGQGLASSSYNDWLSQITARNNLMRQLGLAAASAQTGVGQNLVGASGNAAANLSNIFTARGDNIANAALVKAANASAQGNTIANAFGTLGGSFLSNNQRFGTLPTYQVPYAAGTGYTYNPNSR